VKLSAPDGNEKGLGMIAGGFAVGSSFHREAIRRGQRQDSKSRQAEPAEM